MNIRDDANDDFHFVGRLLWRELPPTHPLFQTMKMRRRGGRNKLLGLMRWPSITILVLLFKEVFGYHCRRAEQEKKMLPVPRAQCAYY